MGSNCSPKCNQGNDVWQADWAKVSGIIWNLLKEFVEDMQKWHIEQNKRYQTHIDELLKRLWICEIVEQFEKNDDM